MEALSSNIQSSPNPDTATRLKSENPADNVPTIGALRNAARH